MGEKKVTIHKSDEDFAYSKMLRSNQLSYRAKGLLAMLLTNDVHWTFIQKQILSSSKEKWDGFKAAWDELCAAGYAKSETTTTHTGKIWVAEIADFPKWRKAKSKKPIPAAGTIFSPKSDTVSEPKELSAEELADIDELYGDGGL